MPKFTFEHAQHNGLYRAEDKYPVATDGPLIPNGGDGMSPPAGINVIFKVRGIPETLTGETGWIKLDKGPDRCSRVVFFTMINDHPRCFFMADVEAWQLSAPKPCLLRNYNHH